VFHSSRKESWIITASGLTKVAQFGEIDAKLTNYSYDHGSFMLDFTGAAIEESDGRIIFGTNRECVEYDPYFLHKGSSNPKFIMESISIDNKRLSADKGSIQVLNTAQLRLEYSVLNWGQNTVKKCKYALLKRNSQDTIWISTQLNMPIILNSLNSGDYQFLVKVKEGDAEVVFKGQKFAFIPPWYRSIWAFLSFAILAFVLINFVVRFRLRYLQLKQIELEGIVEHRTIELKKEKAELFRLNKEIEKAMEEKDVVIYEMHHRVKNNLQTISTLLDLQIRTLKNKDGILALQNAIRRITAMSSSHELLYSSDDLTHINLKSFIAHLIHSQEQIFQNTENKCELEFEIDDFDIDVSSCISLGMIVSEIVSNSIKHAFIQVENPKIVFKATQIEGQCCFSVEDNGVGLPEDAIEEQPKSLGLRLIRIFVAKLKGKYVMENINPGLKIMITFPIKSVETK
jgi:two-component sensor histidine kinase